MMDTHDGTGRPPGTPSEVVRLPYIPVALVLLALIIAVTAGALYLTRHARSDATTVVEATVFPTASVPPTAVPIVAAAATPTALATATTVPTVTSTVVPTTKPSGVAATSTPGSVAPATNGASGTRVATTPLEKEIETAYLRYWEVYRQAAATDDTSHLNEVLAGDALKWTTDELNQRKSQGRGADIRTNHTYFLRRVTADTAEVDDQYTDNSVWIDLKSGQLVPRTAPPDTVVATSQLHKMDGVWKVVSGTRDERK